MTETPEAPPVDQGQAVDAGQGSQAVGNSWFSGFEQEDIDFIKNKGWDGDDGAQRAFQSYKSLEKLRGVPEDQIIKLPKDGESWDSVYQKLGRPQEAKDYQVEAPEGVTFDEHRIDWFNNTAHKLGLNKTQHNEMVKAAVEYESQIIKNYQEESEAQKQESLSKLKQDWGNKYDERKHLATTALSKYLDDNSEEAVKQMQQVMGHGEVMRLFAKIGERMGEDTMKPDGGDGGFGYSPEQAKDDITKLKTELKADTKRLADYNNATGPDYEKMQRLLKQAYAS